MRKFNVYDFDKTVYDGDSSIDFYLFCLKLNPHLILLLPYMCIYFFMYKLKLVEKKIFKEKFFSILKYIRDIDNTIDLFWSKNEFKIKKWFLDDKSENKIIISASPEFLLKPICEKIGVTDLIASVVNKKDGKFISENCYGQEKLKRLNQKYNDYIIEKFYSDSKSDIYLAQKSINSYLVNKNNIIKWEITRKDV